MHRNLRFSNVLYAHGKTMPIDFDEGGFGFYLHDFASSLAGAWLRPDYTKGSECIPNPFIYSPQVKHKQRINL